MKYQEVEHEIARLCAAATEASRRSFGLRAAVTLVSREEVHEVLGDELTDEASGALLDAAARLGGASARQVREWLATIDDGVLSDGDMAPALVRALTALEAWADYLESGSADPIAVLAMGLIERTDFEIGGAPLGDFLAPPEMHDVFQSIAARLRAIDVGQVP